MPRYVVLETFTDQGVRDFRNSPKARIEASRVSMARLDAEIVDVYWTPMGPYDIVSIVGAPDDETVSAILLNDASKGNVEPLIMRAFGQAEMSALVDRVPE